MYFSRRKRNGENRQIFGVIMLQFLKVVIFGRKNRFYGACPTWVIRNFYFFTGNSFLSIYTTFKTCGGELSQKWCTLPPPSRLILLPLIRKGVGIKSSGKFAKGPRKSARRSNSIINNILLIRARIFDISTLKILFNVVLQ